MVTICAKGLNVAYHISRLASRGIVIHNIVKAGRHISLCCSSAHVPYVVQYLTDNDFCDIIVNSMGFYAVLSGIGRHIALCAMLLLLIPLLWLNSIFCTAIEVSGDIDSSSVLQALSDIGVSVGSRLDQLDYDSIEDYLSSTLDLSYTVVEVVGNRLYVSTIDNTTPSPAIDYTQSHDILASYSGTVTSISVVQGTAVVTVGQQVSEGDTLISGVRTYSDGTTTPIYAIGTVMATVSVSSTVHYDGYMQQWQYTGNSCTIVSIDIGNSVVYSSSCNYQYYDVTSTVVSLYPLAIDVTYYYYTEKLSATVVVTFDQYIDSMQQQALQQAMQLAYFTVDNTIYSAVYNSSVTVTLLGNIVISSDTLASNGG